MAESKPATPPADETPKAAPAPSVGRVVHYTTAKEVDLPDTLPAIVLSVEEATKEDPETVGLFALSAGWQGALLGVQFSEEPKPGHWSWPPRV